MRPDPSMDADEYNERRETAAFAEINFYRQNRNLIGCLAASILANPNVDPFQIGETDVVDQAVKFVQVIVSRGEL